MATSVEAIETARETDHTFTNAAGEDFHYTVFAPSLSGPIPSPSDSNVPVLLCVHGAGMSGDCFFRFARQLQQHSGESGSPSAAPTASYAVPSCIAALEAASNEAKGEDMDMHIITFDQRCHGRSTYAGGEDHLEVEVLMEDFLELLQFAKTSLFPNSHFYLMGHSLGGAVVARALSGNKEALNRVSGVLIIDIVEGTAQLSLSHMADYLRRRPNTFVDVKDAEAWFLRQGGMQNPQGAAVSVPPLLVRSPETGLWQWRTDLRKMESVWGGWFKGLDAAFVSLPCAKMLCTANAERLDTALTVAQMQGKFQFEIMGNGCGHNVMDDATASLVSKLRRFVRRNEVLAQKLRLMNMRIPTHLNNTTVPPRPHPVETEAIGPVATEKRY